MPSSKSFSKSSSKFSKSNIKVPVSKLSFTELIQYNLKFLNGELDKTFYHDGPFDPETLPLLDKLKSINSLGFFTIAGQPSLCKEGVVTVNSKTKKVNDKTEGNWYYKIKQKSYLVGFIEKSESTKKLLLYLHKNKNDKVHINISTKDGKYISNFPGTYNVTKESTRKSEDKSWSKWRLYTNIPNEHSFEDNDIKGFKDCYMFTIAVKKYCEDSVEDILLNYYNTL